MFCDVVNLLGNGVFIVANGYRFVLSRVRDDLDQTANLRLVVQTHAEQLCEGKHDIEPSCDEA